MNELAEIEKEIALELTSVREKLHVLHEREKELLHYVATLNEIKNRGQKNPEGEGDPR